MADKPKRIVLTEADFKDLIRGKIVNKPGADLILQDIGYIKLVKLVRRASIEYLQGLGD